MHYTYIGLYRISFANLHLDFQNEFLLQSLQFSLRDLYAPNEFIQPADLSYHHLSLPPPIEWHSPQADSGRGTTSNVLSLSKLTMTIRPGAIQSHFETGPALRTVSTRPQQQLSNAYRELQKTRNAQLLNRSQA